MLYMCVCYRTLGSAAHKYVREDRDIDVNYGCHTHIIKCVCV